MMRLLLSLCCLALLPALAFAQQDLRDIPPPDPELERQTFVLSAGFEVNLFAADPQIAKPIQMNFDPQGRLWIVSSQTYPQIIPGEKADDKVLILEDHDGDGVSDQTTVFAGGLLLPTGIAPGDGGAYVAGSTELLHLRDTDGDGKADSRTVLLSGFGTEDTHHLIHTFRWGPEQLLYFNQSVYIHSHIETPWGVERLNAGGIWRFRPETWRMSVFARGLVNPWGLDFDEYGTAFATDGAGVEGINYLVPGASYEMAFGAERILHGLNPGSPKHCGLEIVNSRHLPEDWRGSFITCDFRGHRVCRFELSESGSGFVSQERQEVIKSDHVAFRPIDVKTGPDGALYIADWYNPIIQHGEVDFRDPRRDHTHGRIWRVTYQGKPLVDPPDLVQATNAQLAAMLASPERWTREQAKRLLKERGPDVLNAVKEWSRNLDITAPGYHQRRLETLRVYQSLDVVEPELLGSLLRCLDHNVRAAAARVVGDWHQRLDNPLELLTPRATDEHPRVRLEAVRALARIPDPHAIEIAMRALDPDVPSLSAFMPIEERQANQPQKKRVDVDQWLDYALWLTARDLQPVWQPALLSGRIDFGGNARHLAFVLKSAGSAETVPVLIRLLSEERVTPEDRPDVLDVVMEFGNADDFRQLLSLTSASGDSPQTAEILAGLLRAYERRKIVPSGDHQPLDPLLMLKNSHIRALAVGCFGAWRVARLWPQVKVIALSQTADEEVRAAAVTSLAAYGGDEATGLLRSLAASAETISIRQQAVQALLPLDAAVAVDAAIALMQEATEAEQLRPLFDVVLQQQPAIERLAESLRGQTIPADVAIVALRAVNSSGQTLPRLIDALQQAGQITSGPAQLSSTEMESLVNAVLEQGDPAAGERIYRRQELNCLKCHAIGGAGGKVGPDLASLGTSAPIDYLVNSLLDPNQQVKEGYHTQIVITDEGQTLSGILVRQTDTALLLRDAEGRERSVPLNQIELRKQGVSLMPAGLTDKLTRSELIDLVTFLKALGRLPEYTVGTEPVARQWQVMQPTEQAAERVKRVGDAIAAEDDPAFVWQPVYTRVNGSLPLAELPVVHIKERGVRFLRLHLQSADPDGTTATLKFNSPQGLTAWWNGGPLELSESTTVTLRPGQNRLTLSADPQSHAADLRLTLEAASPRVQFAP